MDGYVFITAEYNRSPTGALKNAIDWAYYEWNRKVAGFVGYGSAGGVRAIEHLRTISAELQMATVRRAVQIDLFPIWTEGKSIADFPRHEKDAVEMLDQLAWWVKALKDRPRRRAERPRRSRRATTAAGSRTLRGPAPRTAAGRGGCDLRASWIAG